MIRSLPARNFNQYWLGGDEALNITGAAKEQAPPPAVLNTASAAIAEAISIQQITARPTTLSRARRISLRPPREPSTSVITIRSNGPGAGSDFKSHFVKEILVNC